MGRIGTNHAIANVLRTTALCIPPEERRQHKGLKDKCIEFFKILMLKMAERLLADEVIKPMRPQPYLPWTKAGQLPKLRVHPQVKAHPGYRPKVKAPQHLQERLRLGMSRGRIRFTITLRLIRTPLRLVISVLVFRKRHRILVMSRQGPVLPKILCTAIALSVRQLRTSLHRRRCMVICSLFNRKL